MFIIDKRGPVITGKTLSKLVGTELSVQVDDSEFCLLNWIKGHQPVCCSYVLISILTVSGIN